MISRRKNISVRFGLGLCALTIRLEIYCIVRPLVLLFFGDRAMQHFRQGTTCNSQHVLCRYLLAFWSVCGQKFYTYVNLRTYVNATSSFTYVSFASLPRLFIQIFRSVYFSMLFIPIFGDFRQQTRATKRLRLESVPCSSVLATIGSHQALRLPCVPSSHTFPNKPLGSIPIHPR